MKKTWSTQLDWCLNQRIMKPKKQQWGDLPTKNKYAAFIKQKNTDSCNDYYFWRLKAIPLNYFLIQVGRRCNIIIWCEPFLLSTVTFFTLFICIVLHSWECHTHATFCLLKPLTRNLCLFNKIINRMAKNEEQLNRLFFFNTKTIA